MIAAYKKKSNVAALIFIVGIAALVVLPKQDTSGLVPALVSLFGWVSGIAILYACWCYLKAKGRSSWWMLLLTFTIIGLIGFALLKDLAKDGMSDSERLAKGRGGWPIWAGIVGGGVLAIVIAINVIWAITGSQVARDMEQACKPLIAALESFRTEHNAYPEKLAELVPGYIDDLPRCRKNAKDPVHYFRGDNEEYRLTCYTYFVQKHSYNSKTRNWYNWD